MLTNLLSSLIYFLGFISIVLALNKKTHLSLMFVVALFPLQNIVQRLHVFPAGKDFIDITFLFIIIGWVSSSIVKNEKILKKNIFNNTLLIMFFYTLISVLRSCSYLGYSVFDERGISILMLWKNYMLFPLIFFAVVNNFKNKKQIEIMTIVLGFSILIVAYYTFNQLRWSSGLLSRARINGTFVFLGPNELSAFLSAYGFVFVGFVLLGAKSWKRLFYLAIVSGSFYCVLFLFSRGAYLATLVASIFISIIKSKKVLVLILFVLLCWQVVLPHSVVERISETYNSEGELDQSSASRMELWKESLEIFYSSPLMGVGFGSIAYLRLSGGSFEDSHNMYLRILAEQGIIGILIFLHILRLALRSGWKLYKTALDSFSKGLGLGFVACVLVLIVANIVGNRWTHLQVGAFFWCFAALVVRSNQLIEENMLSKNVIK